MNPLTQVRSCTLVLPDRNIDTDRIIPARFLTTIVRDGLGRHAFNDWRYRADGSEDPEFVLNRAEARNCRILVAGGNFGCGSSREHAPWALLDAGLQAVISCEIADIFRSNALKNGLLALVVSAAEHAWLLKHPGIELLIDVSGQFIELPDGGRILFELDDFTRNCLLQGMDQLDFILSHRASIDAYEEAHA